MESVKILVRVATIEDKEQIFELMTENAKEMGHSEDQKFKIAGENILKDIDYGVFIYAYTEGDNKPAGFMLFTYEWSDWRDGIFFWMQSVHVKQELIAAGVFAKMQEFL